MTARARRLYLLAAAIGLVVVVVLTLQSCLRQSPTGALEIDGWGWNEAEVMPQRDTFGITGSLAAPLTPGRSASVDVALTNPHPHPITIRDLMLSLDAIASPNASAELPCSTDDFSVAQTESDFVVPAEQTASLSQLGWDERHWPKITMVDTDSNQGGCVEATLTLRFSGMGTRAG